MKTDLEAAKDLIDVINPYELAEDFRDHREGACREERARIVAWMKGLDRQTIWHPDTLAERIEREEHLK